MQPRKLTVGFAFFPYGGNGGFKSENPDVRSWFARTLVEASRDERIDHCIFEDFVDTPITMTRNQAVEWARRTGVDVLVMVDSDMCPDCELQTDAMAKPFFASSFAFLYNHYERGPVSICAPYCGPPPLSNTYVFRWANWNNPGTCGEPDWRLESFTREEAERMIGITEVGAQPTGLIMQDIRLYDVLDPPYYAYEWQDERQAEKASTEDVVHTRNASFMALLKLGYNPLYCNWDAWAGHWKPLLVRKPKSVRASEVEASYRKAVQKGQDKVKAFCFMPELFHATEASKEPDQTQAKLAGLVTDLATGNSGAVPLSEFVETVISEFGGSRPFAREIHKLYDAPNTTAPVKARILTFLMRMIEVNTEQGGATHDVRTLTEMELEREIRKIVAPVFSEDHATAAFTNSSIAHPSAE